MDRDHRTLGGTNREDRVASDRSRSWPFPAPGEGMAGPIPEGWLRLRSGSVRSASAAGPAPASSEGTSVGRLHEQSGH
jgi:hypothetical protein